MDIYSGTVTKVQLRQGKHPDPFIGRYSPHTSYYGVRLMVAMELEDGTPIWFFTPYSTYSISSPPGCPIAVTIVEENSWIYGKKSVGHGPSGSFECEEPAAKIKPGDSLSIKGRIKKPTRYGNQLNYVKKVQDV